MRAVLQRVKEASVSVDGSIIGRIGQGWLALVGVTKTDGPNDVDYLVDKIINLRAFSDHDGKMNLSAIETHKAILVVSQFTLYGDCRKGRRPGFSDAASPGLAEQLYNALIASIRSVGLEVASGKFQTHMEISLLNDGPVTLLLDSNKNF